VNHQAKSQMLRECLRQAADGAWNLAAHTVGTTCIVLGSMIAKSLVGPLPGSPPPSAEQTPAPSPETAVAAPEDHSFKGAA
jgi:hypothetical protein